MSPEVLEFQQRPSQKLSDFLENMSEDDLLRELDMPAEPVNRIDGASEFRDPNDTGLESNTRLTIIKMFETVPEMERPFTFSVRKYCGPAYVQAMRTTLAKARKLARVNNYEMGEPFRMLVIATETQALCDMVTVMRVPKGKKSAPMLEGLAKLMGGSQVDEDED